MPGKRKPCRGCGGEKDRGHGHSYCSTCAEARSQPQYEPEGPCASCGGPVPLGLKGPRTICDRLECRDALMYWAVARSERVLQARRDRLAGERTCKNCGATHPLDNEHFPKTGPSSFRNVCRECWRAQARVMKREYESRPKTKAERAERAERARLAHGLRVERLTGSPPARHSSVAMNAYKRATGNSPDSVPVEPLAAWVSTLIEREVPDRGRPTGSEMSSRDDRSRTIGDLCAELGIEDRVLYRIEHRTFETVTLGLADRMLMGYGKTLTINGEAAAARIAEECRAMPGNGERILRYIDLAERIAHLDGVVVDRVEDLWPELA